MDKAMTATYYRDLLTKHGPTHQAVDAGSEYTHRLRLQVLTSFIPDMHSSVLDVGCGLGHLIDYGTGINKPGYLGLDVLPEMIEAAQLRRPGWHFEIGDIGKPTDKWAADYVLASGLFQFSNWKFVWQTLSDMFWLCKKGVAVNFLRQGSDKEFIISPHEFYKLGLPVTNDGKHFYTIRADYLPNDFTLFLYKEKP